MMTDYQQFLDHHAAIGKNKHKFFFREWYMNHFAPPTGARILDLGGYVGATAIHYAKKGHRVTSIEGAAEYCEQFRKNVEAAELTDKIDLRHCLIEDFHEPGEFEAACCTEILDKVVDPKRVLAVIHESLKDDGLVFVTVAETNNRYMLDGLYDDVSQAGFDVRCERFDDDEHVPQLIAKGIKAS